MAYYKARIIPSKSVSHPSAQERPDQSSRNEQGCRERPQNSDFTGAAGRDWLIARLVQYLRIERLYQLEFNITKVTGKDQPKHASTYIALTMKHLMSIYTVSNVTRPTTTCLALFTVVLHYPLRCRNCKIQTYEALLDA